MKSTTRPLSSPQSSSRAASEPGPAFSGSNGAVPWSLGEPLEFLRLLWAVAHALHSTSKRLEATMGITGPQRLALQMIGRFPQITAGQLARLLHVDPSTLTGIVQRLVRRGLIQRRPDAQDGRRTLLGLTAEGRRFDLATGRPGGTAKVGKAARTPAGTPARATARTTKSARESATETAESAVARALARLRPQDVAAARRTLTSLTEALGSGGSRAGSGAGAGKKAAGAAEKKAGAPRRPAAAARPIRRLPTRSRASGAVLAHS